MAEKLHDFYVEWLTKSTVLCRMADTAQAQFKRNIRMYERHFLDSWADDTDLSKVLEKHEP